MDESVHVFRAPVSICSKPGIFFFCSSSVFNEVLLTVNLVVATIFVLCATEFILGRKVFLVLV